MEKVRRRGQMEQSLMENGLKVKCTDQEPSYMPIKTSMWVTLKMIKLMVEEFTHKRTEKYMKVIGWMIDLMETACRK